MFQPRDDRSNRTQIMLSLSDNTVMTVLVRMPLSNRLGDALNSSDSFLDVITATGEQQFIAKTMIRSVRSAAIPKADQLEAGTASFDPHAILKVGKQATAEEVRQAYHRMARLYHPDRIASYDLPDEVKAYARDMLVRINLAFEQIGR